MKGWNFLKMAKASKSKVKSLCLTKTNGTRGNGDISPDTVLSLEAQSGKDDVKCHLFHDSPL